MVSHSGPCEFIIFKLKLIPGHGNAGACLLCDLLGIRLKANSKRNMQPPDLYGLEPHFAVSLCSYISPGVIPGYC